MSKQEKRNIERQKRRIIKIKSGSVGQEFLKTYDNVIGKIFNIHSTNLNSLDGFVITERDIAIASKQFKMSNENLFFNDFEIINLNEKMINETFEKIT